MIFQAHCNSVSSSFLSFLILSLWKCRSEFLIYTIFFLPDELLWMVLNMSCLLVMSSLIFHFYENVFIYPSLLKDNFTEYWIPIWCLFLFFFTILSISLYFLAFMVSEGKSAIILTFVPLRKVFVFLSDFFQDFFFVFGFIQLECDMLRCSFFIFILHLYHLVISKFLRSELWCH